MVLRLGFYDDTLVYYLILYYILLYYTHAYNNMI